MILLELLPVALLGGILGLDVVSFPQAMISRPIVAATLAGALAGDAAAGLLIGALLELFAIEMLAVGASRYPEWGSASVVGGTLFAATPVGASRAGALAAAIAIALATAWVGGWSMYVLRRFNGREARRRLPALESGSTDALLGLQLTGLTADLVRGTLVTALALVALAPLAAMVARGWSAGDLVTRAAVLAVAVGTGASAAWRLFHGAAGAHWWFLGGLVAGVVMVALR